MIWAGYGMGAQLRELLFEMAQAQALVAWNHQRETTPRRHVAERAIWRSALKRGRRLDSTWQCQIGRLWHPRTERR